MLEVSYNLSSFLYKFFIVFSSSCYDLKSIDVFTMQQRKVIYSACLCPRHTISRVDRTASTCSYTQGSGFAKLKANLQYQKERETYLYKFPYKYVQNAVRTHRICAKWSVLSNRILGERNDHGTIVTTP